MNVFGFGIILILLSTMTLPSAYNFQDALAPEGVNVVVPVAANAARFLLDYTYNATLDLCSEIYGNSGNSLNYSGQVFWICSDNLLAYYALRQYNETVSNAIRDTIKAYAKNYSLPTDSSGIPISYKHEPIIGDSLPEGIPHTPNLYTLRNETALLIMTEANNGTSWDNWVDYADEWAWQGLRFINQGKTMEALSCYNSMMRMWDGIGFADAAYNETIANGHGCYVSFKLALAIILRQRLSLAKPPQESKMEDILATCQQPDGGIATGYDEILSTAGHNANTETTALVILANVGKSNATKVGFFYYVWYNGTLGQGHWNGTPPDDPNSTKWTVVDEPVLGFYNSSDPKVIKQHLEWFRELGIDFLFVSWWGPNSFEDNATKTLFSIAAQYGYPIQFAIMVEAYDWSGLYDFKTIYDYITDTYVTPYGNIYMRLYDLPLVCFFNDNINMTRTEENRTAIRSVSGFSARIIGQSNYVDWYAWRPCSTDGEDYPSVFPKLSEDGFTCIEPRYDDSHIGGHSTFDEDYTEGLYDEQWRTAQEYRDQGNLSIVAIYSWNEYHERSEIEPHISPEGKLVLMPFSKTYHYTQSILETIPEFPSLLMPLILMIATLLTIMVYRREGHERRMKTE
jgi:hypothetical protein